MKGLAFEDSPYIKAYTEDPADFLMMSADARGFYWLLYRAANRAGLITLGKIGRDMAHRAVARRVADDEAHTKRCLDELIESGFVTWSERDGQNAVVIVEYVEAQNARMSDKAKVRAYRERKHADAISSSRPFSSGAYGNNSLPAVTDGNRLLPDVTLDQIRSDQTRSARSDEKRSDPSPTGEGVQGGNLRLEERTQRVASPPTDRCPVSAAQPPARSQGSVQLAIPETTPEDPPRKSQTHAKPKAAAKPKKPAPPPPPSPKPLTDAERIVAEAIREDETLGRITRNIEQFARDLVRCCPLVDLVLEIRNLGAYTRTPKGMANRYTDGNRFLLGNLQKKQREQAERQAHLEAIKPPPVPKKNPPPDDYVPPWKRDGYKRPEIPAGDFETVFPQLLANIGFKVPPPDVELDFDGFENRRASGS